MDLPASTGRTYCAPESQEVVRVDFHDTDPIPCEQPLNVIPAATERNNLSVAEPMKLSVGSFHLTIPNGQKEGIRDVTVKRKLQTVRKFLSYLEDAQTDDLQNIDRKNVYEFVNSLDYRSQTISGVQFTLRQFFNIMYEQRLSSFDGYQLFPMITTDKRDSILSYYSPEEIKILVESIDTAKKCGIRDKCMIPSFCPFLNISMYLALFIIFSFHLPSTFSIAGIFDLKMDRKKESGM